MVDHVQAADSKSENTAGLSDPFGDPQAWLAIADAFFRSLNRKKAPTLMPRAQTAPSTDQATLKTAILPVELVRYLSGAAIGTDGTAFHATAIDLGDDDDVDLAIRSTMANGPDGELQHLSLLHAMMPRTGRTGLWLRSADNGYHHGTVILDRSLHRTPEQSDPADFEYHAALSAMTSNSGELMAAALTSAAGLQIYQDLVHIFREYPPASVRAIIRLPRLYGGHNKVVPPLLGALREAESYLAWSGSESRIDDIVLSS